MRFGNIEPFQIYYGPASASQSGFVTTGTQTFNGNKTFAGNVVVGSTHGISLLPNQGNSSIGASLRTDPSGVNLIVNANGSGGILYLNNDSGTGGVKFGNGAATTVSVMDTFGRIALASSSAPGCAVDAYGNIRSIAQANPSTGTGGEMFWSGLATKILSIDRGAGVQKPTDIQGTPITISPNAVTNFTVNGTANIHAVPVQMKSYTVATLPAASVGAGSVVWVSNESAGAQLAVSNGTNWVLVADGTTIVS